MGCKRNIFLFYKLTHDPYGNLPPKTELYAYTENKTYAKIFRQTRGTDAFVMTKKNVDELYLPLFENTHKDKMLFMNVLTDGNESFDFVTTYHEDSLITYECDQINDRFMEATKNLLVVPFEKDVRESLEVMYNTIHSSMLSESPFGTYNTFNIFTKLFADTLV